MGLLNTYQQVKKKIGQLFTNRRKVSETKEMIPCYSCGRVRKLEAACIFSRYFSSWRSHIILRGLPGL